MNMLIREYQTQWSIDFAKISKVIAQELTGLKVSIEHVGSTAIPDLDGKPVIDIDISYLPTVQFHDIKRRLENLGYYYKGNQGILDREVFKRSQDRGPHAILDKIRHHLYVCPINSKELRRHLMFRDYLRAHPAERKAYQRLKYLLAAEAGQDRKQYAQLKEIKARDFIEAVLIKAGYDENQRAGNSYDTEKI